MSMNHSTMVGIISGRKLTAACRCGVSQGVTDRVNENGCNWTGISYWTGSFYSNGFYWAGFYYWTGSSMLD